MLPRHAGRRFERRSPLLHRAILLLGTAWLACACRDAGKSQAAGSTATEPPPSNARSERPGFPRAAGPAVGAASAGAGGSPASAPAGAPAAEPEPSEEPPTCRVIEENGRVQTSAGLEIRKRTPLDGSTWLELDRDASVTVKHAQSGREYRLVGPGRALACREGREEVLLTAGSFESAAGPGARPGAFVLVATAHAYLRYGDGQFRVRVTGHKTDFRALAGVARVEEPGGPTAALDPRTGPVVLPTGTETRTEGLAAKVARCERAATEARKGAAELVENPGRQASLGSRAADQVARRQQAHGACAVAAAAAAGVRDTAERRQAVDAIARADRIWRQIPAKK